MWWSHQQGVNHPHEFHETCHSVTFLFHEKRLQRMLWHHNARVNSHQRWKQMRFILETFLSSLRDVLVPFWWRFYLVLETFLSRPGDVLRTFWLWSLWRPIEVLVVFILLRIFGPEDVLFWSLAWKREDVLETSLYPQMVHWETSLNHNKTF